MCGSIFQAALIISNMEGAEGYDYEEDPDFHQLDGEGAEDINDPLEDEDWLQLHLLKEEPNDTWLSRLTKCVGRLSTNLKSRLLGSRVS